MNNLKILPIALALAPLALSAQERFATRSGHIAFLSETSVENIAADNHKVTSVLDATTGAIEFAVLIKAFEFEKAMMQEHFNENYMESNTFPKATFKGKVTGAGEDEMKKEGNYMVSVQGDLTIHGVTKPVSFKGSVMVDATGTVKAASEFTITPEDYGIKIPGLVRKNIAEQVKVTVKLDYAKM